MKDDIKKILLNSSNSKTSVNGDLSLNIDLSSDEKKFPSNGISDNIDQYKQYIKEKDASNKYRFVFTINSVCSNVLYNHISEIIEKNDNNVKFYGSKGTAISKVNNSYALYKYEYVNTTEVTLTRADLTKDTGYSHPRCGNFTYCPGVDIFNNHRFRNKEFATVVDTKETGVTRIDYNTISDTIREYNGKNLLIPNGTGETETHLYYKDTFKTYIESVKDNLIEKDGWFGFINPTSLDVLNCKLGSGNRTMDITINKVINNKKACEFIDLYPDRTLFSFVPNKNKSLNREEYNWDYCITYPYKNFYKNELVSFLDTNDSVILNGMLTHFCDSKGNTMTNEELNDLLNTEWNEESLNVTLCTKIKNNIKAGDYIKIHLIVPIKNTTDKEYFTIRTYVKVRNVGIGGYNTMYYFSVNRGDILSGLKSISKSNDGYENPLNGLYCYIQRIANGRPCKYYFRKFRRLPNFKNTNVYNDSKLTNNVIKKVVFNDFDTTLNKLGFGENIYGDKMAQIVYNDDIDTSNIYDNLGRELHELYLTIVKTNRGNKLWYDENKYSDESIECSHCFSDVSSGIDMPWPYVEDENDDYNVHKIHNISSDFSGNPVFPNSVKPLEEHITISGSPQGDNVYEGIFLGDIVELDELNVEEYVLEDVYHRFNTMQREYTNDGEFSAITINEIAADDYDDIGFSATTENYLNNYYINLAPEGYYYKAHYRIPIREFSNVVNDGQHTIVKFDNIESDDSCINISGTTDKNYYFQKGDNIVAYGKNGEKYICTITNVGGDDFTEIEFVSDKALNIDNINNFFKPNILKPSTAYDFDDGSGVYKWRNIESFEFLRPGNELYDGVFTNGAHYTHKNINFFLRRQDPYGLYGLNPVNDDRFPYEYQLLEQYGNGKDITPAQYFTEGDVQLC